MYPTAVRTLLQRDAVIDMEWIATVITLTVVACEISIVRDHCEMRERWSSLPRRLLESTYRGSVGRFSIFFVTLAFAFIKQRFKPVFAFAPVSVMLDCSI